MTSWIRRHEVLWSRGALEDLKDIRRYIAQYQPRAAAKVAARIRKIRDLLRRHPLAGHEGREPGTREVVVDQLYIVIHQVTEETVEILGVVDGRRDRR